MGQLLVICSTVWLDSLQSQDALSTRPQLLIPAPYCPIPILKRLRVVHCFCDRFCLGMFSMYLIKRCSLNGPAKVHWLLLFILIQLALETSADVARSLWSCVETGRRDLRCAHCGLSVTVLWRRYDSLFCAFLENASMAASLLMESGAIPDKDRWMVYWGGS